MSPAGREQRQGQLRAQRAQEGDDTCRALRDDVGASPQGRWPFLAVAADEQPGGARQAQLLDMFPHTTHYEVLALLERG